jgi:hypothetical protein
VGVPGERSRAGRRLRGGDLAANDIAAGQVIAVAYDGTNLLVLSPLGFQPINQSWAETLLSGDVGLTANTDTAIITKSLTMPSTGGPFRVRVDYGLYVGFGTATWQTWVTDGTVVFASPQAGALMWRHRFDSAEAPTID